MGWDNPPVPWRELERRLSWGTSAHRGTGGERAAEPRPRPLARLPAASPPGEGPAWAELHCHSSYSFLDGASAPAELVAEAARLGLAALAITDHDGMYGVPQFAQAAARLREQGGTGIGTIFGAELSLGPPRGSGGAPGLRPHRAPAAQHPGHRGSQPGSPAPATLAASPAAQPSAIVATSPVAQPSAIVATSPVARPPDAPATPRTGVPDPEGRHLLVLARDPEGYRRLCQVISAAHLAGGEKGRPAYDLESLARAHGGHWVVLTGCRKGAVPAALAS